MKRYNFFYKFMPFIFEIFENMMPKQVDPLSAILALGGGLLGGWGGSQSGGPTTQTVQYLPPQYTPQQQAINNLMYYGAMSNLYGKLGGNQGIQDLLNQYIYGIPAGGQTAQRGTSAQDIISGYQQQRKEATETEAGLKSLEGDLKTQTLKSFFDYLDERNQMSSEERANTYEDLNKKRKETIQQLQDLIGTSEADANLLTASAEMKMLNKFKKDNPEEAKAEAEMEGFASSPMLHYDWMNIPGVAEATEKKGALSYVNKMANSDEMNKIYEYSTGEIPTEEITTTPGETTTTPEGGLLGDIMNKDWIAQQFGLVKEGSMKDISDWYDRAARELEQRGIGQYGGYMGSPYERDVGGILGKRGEMESTLGRELETAKIGMERQNWYDMLNALTGLQTLQSNLQTAQTTPWLGAAQQMTNVPWGQTTTQTSPGVGIFPGFIGGTEAGLGLYGIGKNLGFWGQQK